MIKKIKVSIAKLLKILNIKQKVWGIVVLMVSLISALLETLGVSIIVPLVNALLQPEKLLENALIKKLISPIGIETERELIIFVVFSVIAIYIFKNLFFIFACWLKVKYAYMIQREVSVFMMHAYMNRGYEFFLSKNVNELIQGVSSDVVSLYQIVTNLLQIITQLMIVGFICIYMCYADWQISVGIIASAILCLCLIFIFFRKKLSRAGNLYRKYGIKASQVLLQTFHGIKEVIIMRKQNYFLREYEDNTIKKQHAQITQAVGAEIPAYIIEGVCISGIMSILCIKILNIPNPESFVALLASFAVGAFRVLPALGKISSSLNTIVASLPGLNVVYENIVDARKNNLVFFDINSIDDDAGMNNRSNGTIKIEDVSFSYNNGQNNVLENINLKIEKGKSVAFIGESGAGKSTLADLILGLLSANSGDIRLDEVSIRKIPNTWSKIIGYVPQSIYLSDTSICENIAFGIESAEIDEEKVKAALRKAELLDFVMELPEGIYTKVGDRGVRLSGGQKQRIGIARALYHDPQILILDEATSALDNETEKAVMEAIDSLHGKMTLIIIAHRLSTIKNCDVIYEIKDKHVFRRKYEDLIEHE
ncbi:MAG: ABC transporter ATP-binding protein/permease [Lachnospiraceae bacterium]|nr:ABC transporter ATP-binding protein/permease [Lachnospiraceae bacterium]MDD7628487.1 ABC transporter ATP-binding protein [Lachnospiraceae bacterium]MDY4120013.1 ABC transporter ATP-binding protein [Lachnospiraceae bacterium]